MHSDLDSHLVAAQRFVFKDGSLLRVSCPIKSIMIIFLYYLLELLPPSSVLEILTSDVAPFAPSFPVRMLQLLLSSATFVVWMNDCRNYGYSSSKSQYR